MGYFVLYFGVDCGNSIDTACSLYHMDIKCCKNHVSVEKVVSETERSDVLVWKNHVVVMLLKPGRREKRIAFQPNR
jgi:hypothetical protein